MEGYQTRSQQELIACYNAGQKIKYIFFWGHTPPKDNLISKSCFSQWYDSPFSCDGVTFKTAEHFMMARKALLFDDRHMYQQILEANHPGEAKSLGRMVQNFEQAIWEQNRFAIVVEGNYHKFTQNPPLQEFLLKTGTRVIVEASPRDRIWGIGRSQQDPKSQIPSAWQGLNLLGFALMEVRQLIQKLRVKS